MFSGNDADLFVWASATNKVKNNRGRDCVCDVKSPHLFEVACGFEFIPLGLFQNGNTRGLRKRTSTIRRARLSINESEF
jgi:hypothetical protein